MKNNPTIDLLKLLDRPIAFHPSFVSLTGSVNAALMLSQSVYWSNRTSDPQGWFFKTAEEWEEETCLSRREQEIARRKLKATGFWQEELRGIPARMYYRIDQDILRQSLSDGGAQSLTVDQVLDAFGPELVKLSQGGMLRASKLNKGKAEPCKVEHVDYAEILRQHGMVCHICGNPIKRGVGSKPEFLHFDHVHPLHRGGDHTYDNIRPSHAKCNLSKSSSTLDALDSLATDKPVSPCTDNPVSLYTDNLDVSHTDKLYKEAETTTETTTEREREEKLSPPSADTPVSIYQDIRGEGIPIFQQEVLENANISNLSLWREVVTGWRANGYSMRNITGMINQYRERESRKEKGTDYETKRKQAAEYCHKLITNPVDIPSPEKDTDSRRSGVGQGYPAGWPNQFIKPRTFADVFEESRRARDGKPSESVV